MRLPVVGGLRVRVGEPVGEPLEVRAPRLEGRVPVGVGLDGGGLVPGPRGTGPHLGHGVGGPGALVGGAGAGAAGVHPSTLPATITRRSASLVVTLRELKSHGLKTCLP